MRALILFGLFLTLSCVSCRSHYFHRRNLNSLRKYKNKRGIADHLFGLSLPGSPLGIFHVPSTASVSPYTHGISSLSRYGSYGGIPYGNILGHASYNLPIQSSSSLSSLGSTHAVPSYPSLGSISHHNLIGLDSYSNLKPALTIASSPQHVPTSGVNLASLMGTHMNSPVSYTSPNIGLFAPDKSTQPALLFQASFSGPTQAPFKSGYASPQLSGSNYAVPIALGSMHGSGYHSSISMPASALNNLNSYGVPLGSISGHNGLTYRATAASTQPIDPHSAASNNYIFASNVNQQSGSGHNLPMTATASLPSSPSYDLSVPPLFQLMKNLSSPSVSSVYSSSYPGYTVPSEYAVPALDSKYSPISSAINKHAGNDHRLNSASGYLNYHSSKLTVPSSFKSGESIQSSLSHSNYPVNSYGMPAMPYSLPSTNYGTPSQSVSSSSSNSESNKYTSSALNPPSTDGSTFSSSKDNYNYHDLYQLQNAHKQSDNTYKPSTAPYLENHANYKYPSNEYTSEAFNYNNSPPPSLANSVENNLPQDLSTSYEDELNFGRHSYEDESRSGRQSPYDDNSDSSSSDFSKYSRLQNYPLSKGNSYNNEDDVGNSHYDTISYSVPFGKH